MENAAAPDTNSLGPLSPGWERVTIQSGLTYFANGSTNITTYYDPRRPNPHPDGFEPIPLVGPPLPSGWEVVGRPDGAVFYLDHNTHSATRDDPRNPGAGAA